MRLLLIDDHTLFTQSLQFLLAELDASVECKTANSIASALQAEGPFDLILLDFNLPGNTGFAGLQAVRGVFSGTPVVLLSGVEDAEVIRTAVTEGAMGFIPKSSSPQVLMAAMQLVLAGGAYLPPHVLSDSSPHTTHAAQSAAAAVHQKVAGLTDRQLQALLKAVQGKPNKVIAREMDLAEGTIKAHLSTAFRVMGVHNRTEAVFKAAALGLTMPAI